MHELQVLCRWRFAGLHRISDLLALVQERVKVETEAAVHGNTLWGKRHLGFVGGNDGGVEFLAVQNHTLQCHVQGMGASADPWAGHLIG